MPLPFRTPQNHKFRLAGQARSETGSANATLSYVMMFILAVGVYLAFLFVPPFKEKGKLEVKIEEIARNSRGQRSRQDLMREIRKETDILGLEVPPENVEINQDSGGRWIEIRVRYQRFVRLPGGKLIPLDFSAQVFEKL